MELKIEDRDAPKLWGQVRGEQNSLFRTRVAKSPYIFPQEKSPGKQSGLVMTPGLVILRDMAIDFSRYMENYNMVSQGLFIFSQI